MGRSSITEHNVHTHLETVANLTYWHVFGRQEVDTWGKTCESTQQSLGLNQRPWSFEEAMLLAEPLHHTKEEVV